MHVSDWLLVHKCHGKPLSSLTVRTRRGLGPCGQHLILRTSPRGAERLSGWLLSRAPCSKPQTGPLCLSSWLSPLRTTIAQRTADSGEHCALEKAFPAAFETSWRECQGLRCLWAEWPEVVTRPDGKGSPVTCGVAQSVFPGPVIPNANTH